MKMLRSVCPAMIAAKPTQMSLPNGSLQTAATASAPAIQSV